MGLFTCFLGARNNPCKFKSRTCWKLFKRKGPISLSMKLFASYSTQNAYIAGLIAIREKKKSYIFGQDCIKGILSILDILNKGKSILFP